MAQGGQGGQTLLLTIVPLGPLPPGVLDALATSLAAIVPWETAAAAPVAIPDAVSDGGQLDAREALTLLPRGSDSVLVTGVTERDLGVPGYNFVFGYAVPEHFRAAISLHRLHALKREAAANDTMLLDRAGKEVLHEAGHLLGLGHCPDPSCVMHYSQTLQDTDIKSERFCARCSRELSRMPESQHQG
ncbi:MAG: hypothetical protein ACOC7M_01205 [Chloroflexota bacterium]